MHSDKKNSFWLAFQFVISLLVSLVTLKLNLLHFGTEIFGSWILIAAIWGFGSALDFGFGTAVIKYVAEFNRHSKTEINELLSSIFFVFILIGTVIFILGLTFGNIIFFGKSGAVPVIYRENMRLPFLILAITFLLQYVGVFFRSVFEGMNNFVISSRISLVQNITILVGVIIIYQLKSSILILSFIYFTAGIIVLFLYLVLFRKYYVDFKLKASYFNLTLVRKIISFSFSVQLSNIFAAIVDPAIKIIVSNYYQISYVSIYETARRFTLAITGLFFAAFKIILPKTSELRTLNEYQEFLKGKAVGYTRVGVTYSGVFYGVLSLPIVLFIKYWFGYQDATLIFLMLSLPEAINNAGYTNYNFLIGIGKTSIVAFVQFINLLFIFVGLTLGFVLLKNNLGFMGYFISDVIVNALILYFVKKYSKISITGFFIQAKLYKTLIQVMILSILILVIFYTHINLMFVLGTYTLIMIFLFVNDIISYFNILKSFLAEKLGINT